jgi:hypothetical protein
VGRNAHPMPSTLISLSILDIPFWNNLFVTDAPNNLPSCAPKGPVLQGRVKARPEDVSKTEVEQFLATVRAA